MIQLGFFMYNCRRHQTAIDSNDSTHDDDKKDLSICSISCCLVVKNLTTL